VWKEFNWGIVLALATSLMVIVIGIQSRHIGRQTEAITAQTWAIIEMAAPVVVTRPPNPNEDIVKDGEAYILHLTLENVGPRPAHDGKIEWRLFWDAEVDTGTRPLDIMQPNVPTVISIGDSLPQKDSSLHFSVRYRGDEFPDQGFESRGYFLDRRYDFLFDEDTRSWSVRLNQFLR